MTRDELLRLSTLADQVRSAHGGRRIDLEKWQEPKHAHLLRSPTAMVDAVMDELADDGTRGDPLPWAKAAHALRLRPHELTIWGGSNGSAKSTLLSEILLALATAGRRVVIVSLEMPAYKVAAKMVSQAFCRRHPSRDAVLAWAESVGDALTFLDLTGDLEPAEAVKLVRYCAHELNTQHILVDNLTKIVSADNDHAEEQRRFMARMHRSAIDTGIHVHVVAHTRKPAGGAEDRPEGRYDIAGSRTLVDQPDNVVIVWRDRKKEQQRSDGGVSAIDDAEKPDLIVRVDKQRHGRFEGAIRLWMDRAAYRFVEAAGEAAAPMWRG